jgi:hypothetical protein
MWQTVTREQLYEQVWSVPIWTLCQQYGLSDNGLRKICKRLNVPVPPRGYWAKVEAGHKVRKVALPKDAQQSVAQIHVAPKPERTEADDEDDAWLAERVAFERAEANAIAVVTPRRRWHPAVQPLHEFFEREAKAVEASRKADERYQSWPEWRKRRDWNSDGMKWHWVVRNGQLMPSTHHAFPLRLSLATYRRGLAIVNAVAAAATTRGFEVTHDDKKGRVVLVGHGGELELRMSEATEQKTRKVKRYDGKFEDERYRVPTGRLRIFVERGYGKVWTIEETAEGPLETKLNAFFAGVWKQVKFCRQKTREEESRRIRDAAIAAERAEVERMRVEEERIREEERRRRRGLIEEAVAWRRANEIRAYVGAVRAEAELRGAEALASVAPWVEWALHVADEGDPVVARAGC